MIQQVPSIVHVILFILIYRQHLFVVVLGLKYCQVLVDDFSHHVWFVPLAYESRAYQALLDFHAYVKIQFKLPH